MLMQAIRERAQTWVAWVIVILLIVVFAVWGINTYFEPESDPVVAEVDGVTIKMRSFQNAYEQQRARLQSQFGQIDPALFESMGLKTQVLEGLVNEEVQLTRAIDAGYRIGDTYLANYIHQIESFKKNGQFDAALYEQVLSGSSLTSAQWEQSQRRALLLNQPVNGVLKSAFLAQGELDNIARLQKQERTFFYVLFPQANFTESSLVSDEEAKKYYETHREEYKRAESVSVDYVEASVAGLTKNIKVDEEALQQRYNEQLKTFSVPERRRASHILVEVAVDADSDTLAAARKKADDLLVKIKGGESFEELAKTSSDDPGSAKEGGDLGFFDRGTMDKPFEEAAFALKRGELSAVVQSKFGFHIIKLTDIEAEKTKPFAEVRAQLELGYKESQAETLFYEIADRLETLAYERPDSLSSIADELHLEIQSTPFFTRSEGAAIAANPKFRVAAFESDVLEGGNNSPVIELEKNHIAVLRKKEHRAEETKPFDEVKESVLAKLRSDRAAEGAKKAAQEMLIQVKAKREIAALAKEKGLELKEIKAVKRDDNSVDRALLKAIFLAPRPSAVQPTYGELAMPNGDYAIYVVNEVTEGTRASLEESELKALRESLERARGQEEYGALLEEWRKSAKVVTFTDKLN